MNVFAADQITAPADQHFAFLEVREAEQILTITLDRAEKKNALHPQMVNELAFAMQYAHQTPGVWAIVLRAKGSVFCAGADLKAFMGMGAPHDSTIPKPTGEVLLGEVFNKVHKPVVCVVDGDVYAGGFLLLAGSHIVIGQAGIKLGLPEVKRGLFPYQVMTALLRVMPARKVLDWCLRGYNLPAEAAAQDGLFTELCAPELLEERVATIVAELKEGSPTALRMGLEAFDHIQPSADQHRYLMQMLQQTVATPDGQEGLKAFREKRKPNWGR